MRRTASVLTSLLISLAIGAPPTPATIEAFPSATPASQGVSAEALTALRAAVVGYVDEGAVVGAELLVIKDRKTVLHEAVGWRDREDDVPMERNSIFNLRSMTKTLVGAAAQILIDEGKLDASSRAAEFLPGFDNERSRQITVEMLLTHRAGLPLTILTRLDEYPDLVSIGNAVGKRGPQFEPGSKFFYSDAGADALGAIVEKASGESLESFIRTRILVPLGMADTFANLDATDPRLQRVASLYARPQDEWVRFWRPEGTTLYPFLWGSQGLYGTPADYARFLTMWLDDGSGGGRQVLTEDAVSRTLTPVSRMTSLGSDVPTPTNFSGLEVHYGQMAELRTAASGRVSDAGDVSIGPVRIIGHSGSDGTLAWVWPERDLMILYFTQSRGNLTHLRFERAIDELLLNPDSPPAQRPDPAELTPYLGSYVADFGPFSNTEFRVFVQDGFLAVDVPGMLISEFDAPEDLDAPAERGEGEAGFERWESSILPDLAVSFERDPGGKVVAMRWHEGTATFTLPKGEAATEPELRLADVERYLGRYSDPDTGIEVELVFENGSLAANLPGVPMPVEFQPPDDAGYWAVRVNPTLRIRFDEDEDGNVISYTVFGPDGSTSVRPRIGRETS